MLFPLTANATIINVPGDYPTIQGAINHAADGDTVLVQPGTYHENVNFNGHNVVLASLFLTTRDTTYISSTIIDGDSPGPLITFSSGEDSTAQVVGFAIQDGRGVGILCDDSSPTIAHNIIAANSGRYGGGIYCWFSEAMISSNSIRGNSASRGGGGIYCYWFSSPKIADNTISSNSADSIGGGIFCRRFCMPEISNNIITDNWAGLWGGGVACDSTSSNISGNTISDNSAFRGGGIYCDYSGPMITNNTIDSNSVNQYGAGIECIFSDAVISGNMIRHNSASGEYGRGGGVHCMNCSPTIANNTIKGNYAYDGGGGIYCWISTPMIKANVISENRTWGGGGISCNANSDATIANNVITKNSGIYLGGAISCWHSSPIISNSTISANSAGEEGGGIACYFESSPIVTNSIFWGDQAPRAAEVHLGDSRITITYSNIEGGWEGEGNIDVDPLFRDAGNGDFHLMADYCGDPYNSPCIDVGHPDSLDVLLDCFHGLGTDRADMGAYGGRNSGWPTGIEGEENGSVIPNRFLLLQNYPNPFNATTVIEYQVPVNGYVKLEIYNMLGQKLATLVDSKQHAACRSVIWDASEASSGLYFYKLTVGDWSGTKKMTLVK